jgi:hypothetical protein
MWIMGRSLCGVGFDDRLCPSVVRDLLSSRLGAGIGYVSTALYWDYRESDV